MKTFTWIMMETALFSWSLFVGFGAMSIDRTLGILMIPTVWFTGITFMYIVFDDIQTFL